MWVQNQCSGILRLLTDSQGLTTDWSNPSKSLWIGLDSRFLHYFRLNVFFFTTSFTIYHRCIALSTPKVVLASLMESRKPKLETTRRVNGSNIRFLLNCRIFESFPSTCSSSSFATHHGYSSPPFLVVLLNVCQEEDVGGGQIFHFYTLRYTHVLPSFPFSPSFFFFFRDWMAALLVLCWLTWRTDDDNTSYHDYY